MDDTAALDLPLTEPPKLGQCIATGLSIAAIGSVLWALVELGAGLYVAYSHLAGLGVPADLIVAAFAKFALSHTLLWCPLVTLSVIIWVRIRRASPRRLDPGLAAAFCLFSSLIIIPADLTMAGRNDGLLQVGSAVAVLVGALLIFFTLKFFMDKMGSARFVRWRNVAGVAAILTTVTASIASFESPLFNAAAYCIPSTSPQSATPGPPNLLWIVMDTVRYDHVDYGDQDEPATPFLNEWAKRSIVFERAVANGIWTLPNHASMFTGLPVRQHGATRNYQHLVGSNTTVAEVLAEAGYETVLFSNNPWFTPATNLCQGFERQRLLIQLRRLGQFSLQYWCEKLGLTPPVPWLDPDYGAALTNQLVARWLTDRSDGSKPFFCFINYMEAHMPYRVPRQYRRTFLDPQQVHRSYELRRSVFGDMVPALARRFNTAGADFITQADRRILKLQYQSAVAYLDSRVGEIIDFFSQQGLLENTWVIVTSDHGEYLDTHGQWDHRFMTYDDLIHIPLFIREPGRTQGTLIQTAVQLSDIANTVLKALLGRTLAPVGFDSLDLLALTRFDGAHRIAVAEYFGAEKEYRAQIAPLNNPTLDHRAQAQLAAVGRRFKYIQSQDGQHALYDLMVDPGELNNLIDQRVDEPRRLAGFLARWQTQVPTHVPVAGQAPQQSDQVTNILKSLGYVGEQE